MLWHFLRSLPAAESVAKALSLDMAELVNFLPFLVRLLFSKDFSFAFDR